MEQNTSSNAQDIITYMESLRNEEQRKVLMGFFKTAPGEYGYGDEFLGLKVPQTREIVKSVAQYFPLGEIPELLMNRWHEVRLCGFLILVARFEKLATKRLENNPDAIKQRDEILTMYLQYAEQANNWDLVDLSAPKILGHWLLLPTNLGHHPDLPPIGEEDRLQKDYKLKVLDDLAASPCLWKQRMSIVCTWKTSHQGDPSWCLRYAEIHLHHPHDLMHKAVGWMLREMGKSRPEVNAASKRGQSEDRFEFAEREQSRPGGQRWHGPPARLSPPACPHNAPHHAPLRHRKDV